MKAILFSTYLFLSCTLYGQQSACHFMVKGLVLDSLTNMPLELTNIEIVGHKVRDISSDKDGRFILTGLCQGALELHISHQQCEHIHIHLKLSGDTAITVYLKHEEHQLEGYTAVIKNDKQENIDKLNAKSLELKKGSSISELMQGIGGITLLKTGSTISKPIVNGLHGNRVIILNNGVRQEGQNWGLEHAPEIDAFLATEIELMKGAEALRYASDGVGGIIMIRPPSVFNEKVHQLRGEMNEVVGTNGRGGTTSLILGNKLSDKIPIYWRLQGTFKKSGNVRAPDYFLSNTGMEEMNYSAALGYQTHQFKLELFHSSFYNKIAIFKGSQIGSINDLQKAFNSDTPTVVSGFTYAIDRPFQKVNHALSKLNSEWLLSSKNKIQLSVAYQQNHRQEYDKLRSSASFKGPDFNYYINTLLGDLTFIRTDLHRFNFSTGLNGIYQANSYTGRFFIPGFYNKGMAAYVIVDKSIRRLKFEAALRYDYKHLTAYLWSGNNLTIAQLTFHNATYLLQAVYQKNKRLRFSVSTSSAWRPPAPNELYSNGLHQGLATIEIGDARLQPERSFNQVFAARYAHKQWFIETEIYYKRINGFINLIPSLPPQITIRGAFPVYQYVQQDVALTGLNVVARREFKNDFYAKVSSNLMVGENISEHIPLSQMPPLSGQLWLGKETKKYMFQFWYQATARQYRYIDGSDYVAPPKGYVLFGCDASVEFKIKKQPFKFNLSVNNLLNTTYRQYLNRFRYFSDEQGFALTARLIIPLNFKINK